MTRKQAIKLFGEKKVRTIWDDEKEQWYFCVVDVVEVLTESKDPSGYIKTMKRRDPMLAKGWTNCHPPFRSDPWRTAENELLDNEGNLPYHTGNNITQGRAF